METLDKSTCKDTPEQEGGTSYSTTLQNLDIDAWEEPMGNASTANAPLSAAVQPYEDLTSPLTVQDLERQVLSRWSTRQDTPYTAVHVLLVRWEECDAESSTELDETTPKLRELFSTIYNFTVTEYHIPSHKPHHALNRRLLELADLDAPETLFIIWYDGHGREHPDRRGAPRWFSGSTPEAGAASASSPELDSSIVTTVLGACEADVLLVHNSCQSLTTERTSGPGLFDCLSASAFDTYTYGGLNDHSPSMTWAVVQILGNEAVADGGISVAELHRLVGVATQWAGSPNRPVVENSKLREWVTTNTRTQPVHTRLSSSSSSSSSGSSKTGRRDIRIQKLKPRPSATAEIKAHREQYAEELAWGAAGFNLRMIVDFEKHRGLDARAWREWILAAPSEVLELKIED